MDSLVIGPPPTPPPAANPKPPARRPVVPAAKSVANSLQEPDRLDLSADLALNDYSDDLKSKRDEFLGYRQLWVKFGGGKTTVYGLQYGRETDLKRLGPVRLGYQWSGTFTASGDSVHLGGDMGGKAFFGTEHAARHFLPGMPVPVGIYVAAGPSLNVSNFAGNSSVGAGLYGAAGLDLFGFNFEVRQDLATNYNGLGLRGGFQIRF